MLACFRHNNLRTLAERRSAIGQKQTWASRRFDICQGRYSRCVQNSKGTEMQVSNVEVDAFGRLAVSGIHDAIVKELHFLEGGFFSIRLHGVNGENRVIRLNGIECIGFQNVINGTIMSDIFCLKLNSTHVVSNELRVAWRTLLGDTCTEHDLKDVVDDLAARHADAFFVVFESAYGGSISAICSEIVCI